MSGRTVVLFVIPCVLFFGGSVGELPKLRCDETVAPVCEAFASVNGIEFGNKQKMFRRLQALRSACRTSRDCHPLEICHKDSCQCSNGYVRVLHECLPVKVYGEECSHDAQCNDDRMVCMDEEYGVQQKRFCVCDIYHFWNSTTQECLDLLNVTKNSLYFRGVYDVGGMIELSAQKVFYGVVIAGVVCVSLLLSFITICSVYGCCETGRKGSYGEGDGRDENNAAVEVPQGTYEAMDTDFGDMAF